MRPDDLAHSATNSIAFNRRFEQLSRGHESDFRRNRTAFPNPEYAKITIKRPPFYRQPCKIPLVTQSMLRRKHSSQDTQPPVAYLHLAGLFHRELLSPLCSATSKDGSAVLRAHSCPKTVHFHASAFFRLICSLCCHSSIERMMPVFSLFVNHVRDFFLPHVYSNRQIHNRYLVKDL